MLVLFDYDLEKICRGWAVVWVGCGGGAGSGGGSGRGLQGLGWGLQRLANLVEIWPGQNSDKTSLL